MEKLNNRQKLAEMKARIIDEWIALNAQACIEIPNELEDHLFEIAEENLEDETISFNIENIDYLATLVNESLINIDFDWLIDIKLNGLYGCVNKYYGCKITFAVRL